MRVKLAVVFSPKKEIQTRYNLPYLVLLLLRCERYPDLRSQERNEQSEKQHSSNCCLIRILESS